VTVAADTQALHRGLRLAQRYQLAERLERGALATVYRGQDLVLRRPIVVKAVPPEQVAAYQESLRASARLAHPAAIGVYDALEQDGWLFLVQEFVNGRPISAYFRQGVPAERTVDLARQIASALAYAHTHGITHGDLTPTAVLVDRHANVRLNNFGLPPDIDYFARSALAIAASLASDDPTVELPATAEISSPAHPAPADLAPASPGGDTRAAGYLLWHLLTEPVLDAAGIEREDGGRRFRGEVPRQLRELVVAAVADSARQPIADAQTLALALERLGEELAGGRTISAPVSPPAAVLAARAAPGPSWSAEDTLQGNRTYARPATAAVRPDGENAPPLPARLADGAPPAQPAFAPAFPARGEPRAPAPVWAAAAAGEPRAGQHRQTFAGGYEASNETARRGLPMVAVLLLGAVLFILFFLVGYFSQLSLR
jgi:hypothetical protein